ncbi:hypothetical protein GCM10011594_09440 [Nakamurella endophytica]|uniref:DUF3040 domain-containing protein n=2 Tax=Nakamurella endophytica TaxID=1748367 RepID=A0A917WBK2_9ACTN|nr:hypothetical protein GCM10011594_09440 [Nakamurella endophytica]
MALSEQERRQLSELGQQLAREDPELALRLAAGPRGASPGRPATRRWLLLSSAALVLGAVIAGVLGYIMDQSAGFGLAMVCCTLAGVGSIVAHLPAPAPRAAVPGRHRGRR